MGLALAAVLFDGWVDPNFGRRGELNYREEGDLWSKPGSLILSVRMQNEFCAPARRLCLG